MPLYEYKCQKCGKQFEVMQKFADEPLTTHEACGGPVDRLLSAPALQFKGSGWYITDYAKGKASGTSKPGESSSADGSKTETKSDSKSESKPETKSDSGSSSSTSTTTSSSSSDSK